MGKYRNTTRGSLDALSDIVMNNSFKDLSCIFLAWGSDLDDEGLTAYRSFGWISPLWNGTDSDSDSDRQPPFNPRTMSRPLSLSLGSANLVRFYFKIEEEKANPHAHAKVVRCWIERASDSSQDEASSFSFLFFSFFLSFLSQVRSTCNIPIKILRLPVSNVVQ